MALPPRTSLSEKKSALNSILWNRTLATCLRRSDNHVMADTSYARCPQYAAGRVNSEDEVRLFADAFTRTLVW